FRSLGMGYCLEGQWLRGVGSGGGGALVVGFRLAVASGGRRWLHVRHHHSFEPLGRVFVPGLLRTGAGAGSGGTFKLVLALAAGGLVAGHVAIVGCVESGPLLSLAAPATRTARPLTV